jgi:putative ABC transport system ATP-binding protein
MLDIDAVQKYYSSPAGTINAVDNATIRVRPGEVVAILGPSGSGKTTLLMLAAGLLRADRGVVRFEGRDLATLSKRDVLEFRRTKLGFVFQNFNLVAGLTAEENVAMPLLLRGAKHNYARSRALAALGDVGLADRAEHGADRLSGGEQQRVSIARAIVGNPKLVLADEPTGNLDTETGDIVLELLGALPRKHGAATVIVTHDARIARHVDRVLSMRDGKLLDPDFEAALEE